MIRLSLYWAALLTATAFNLSAQDNTQSGNEDKRILWFFTNHRTTNESAEATTLTPHGKFTIAWDDATDRAIFLQTAFSCWNRSGGGLQSFLRARPRGLCQTSRHHLRRFRRGKHDDGGRFPDAISSGSSLLPPQRGHEPVETAVRHEPSFRYPRRFGKE